MTNLSQPPDNSPSLLSPDISTMTTASTMSHLASPITVSSSAMSTIIPMIPTQTKATTTTTVSTTSAMSLLAPYLSMMSTSPVHQNPPPGALSNFPPDYNNLHAVYPHTSALFLCFSSKLHQTTKKPHWTCPDSCQS